MAPVFLDPMMGTVYNDTDVDSSEVMQAMLYQHPEVASLARWASGTRRSSSIFERDKYVTPDNIFDQMRVAQDAAQNDDVVAGVVEATEAMAFGKMSIECEDDDEENVWAQIQEDIQLDARMREMWRELFTVSQFYAAVLWGRKTYRLKGRNPKTDVKRKKVFPQVYAPIGISLLDPLRVIPVGNLLFNQEELAYISTDQAEQSAIQAVLDGSNRSSDEMVSQLMTGLYEPSKEDAKLLSDMGIGRAKLFRLNPETVFRHTATRPQYQRWADVRLKSIFELIDLKHQLRENDRATLIGGTNFIVLVKKGTDQKPALPAEVANLQAQVRTLARVPVLVGDHRLEVEIVTPNNDHTLDAKRYDVLDSKIAGRLYQQFSNNSSASSRDDSLKVGRVVARGMESRRYMLSCAIERYILTPTFEKNDIFTEEPELLFHPKQIALDFDAALASFMFDLRDRGDISRKTILEQIDLDQDKEASNRKMEEEVYDKVFQTAVPFNSPANNPVGPGGQPVNPTAKPAVNTGNGGGVAKQKTAGRTGGGNRNGGGAAPGSGQGKPAVNPRKKSS